LSTRIALVMVVVQLSLLSLLVANALALASPLHSYSACARTS